MRKIGLVLASSVFIFAVTSVNLVSAQDSATTTDDSNRQARIEEYKQRVSEQLTEAQTERISARCTAAQRKISQLQTNISSVIQRRTIIYTNLKEKLETVESSISQVDLDTTELKALIEQMSNKVEVVLASAESYESVLDDLAAMDCSADVEGFQSTLQVAREERARLIENAKDLKDFVSTDVKAEIQNLRSSIATDSESNTSTEEEVAS